MPESDTRNPTTVGPDTADVVLPFPDRRRRSSHDEAFRALTEHAPDAIARLSRTGRLLAANRMVATLLRRPPSQIVGLELRASGLPIDVAAAYLRGIRRTFRSGKEHTFDVSIGVEVVRHYTVRIVPEFDDDTMSSVLAITYDVTQRTEADRRRDELLALEQAARERAEAASQARDQFLAVVSHELRSPLNGIQSWSHVLENQFSGAEHVGTVARRALEGIRDGVAQQVSLIEHLLDATVAMTGTLRLVRESLVLREAIEVALARIRTAAIAKDIAVHADLELTGERMDGDAHRIRQLVEHLLSNAVKFTPKGGSIWVTARAGPEGGTIAVRDSGRGLPPGHGDWLFEPFRQADSSNTRRAGGIGLGLAVARRLAELHGGRIAAESAGPHLGATFTVTLPLSASADTAAEQCPPPVPVPTVTRAAEELADLLVLVIDDQRESREALGALLSQFGAKVRTAGSSEAALATIEQAADLPDIVICDIAMPQEDGYGFVLRLRARESAFATGRRTPVIALSAFTASEPVAGANGARFDAGLAKPVDPQRLLVTLKRLAPRPRFFDDQMRLARRVTRKTP